MTGSNVLFVGGIVKCSFFLAFCTPWFFAEIFSLDNVYRSAYYDSRTNKDGEDIDAVRIIKKDVPAEYSVLIQKFRLIDDTFFNVCFDNYTEGMQLLLRIFFGRDDLIVKRVVTQQSATISMDVACASMCWQRTARESSTTARFSGQMKEQPRVGHAITAA